MKISNDFLFEMYLSSIRFCEETTLFSLPDFSVQNCDCLHHSYQFPANFGHPLFIIVDKRFLKISLLTLNVNLERTNRHDIFSTPIIGKTIERNSKQCISFVDITKARSVNRDLLFKIIEHIKCPSTIISLIKNMHQNTISTVKIENDYAQDFCVNTRERQGCELAPFYFIIYIHAIIQRMTLFQVSSLYRSQIII